MTANRKASSSISSVRIKTSFAWSPKDMPGVPTEFAEHKLHVRPDVKPVRQPLRRLSEEKGRVVGEEIARLLAAGFIMEVFFPEWLANPVLVL